MCASGFYKLDCVYTPFLQDALYPEVSSEMQYYICGKSLELTIFLSTFQ